MMVEDEVVSHHDELVSIEEGQGHQNDGEVSIFFKPLSSSLTLLEISWSEFVPNKFFGLV